MYFLQQLFSILYETAGMIMRCAANRSKALVRDNLHNSPLLLEMELLQTQTDNILMP